MPLSEHSMGVMGLASPKGTSREAEDGAPCSLSQCQGLRC